MRFWCKFLIYFFKIICISINLRPWYVQLDSFHVAMWHSICLQLFSMLIFFTDSKISVQIHFSYFAFNFLPNIKG